jgi:hypothetical protein
MDLPKQDTGQTTGGFQDDPTDTSALFTEQAVKNEYRRQLAELHDLESGLASIRQTQERRSSANEDIWNAVTLKLPHAERTDRGVEIRLAHDAAREDDVGLSGYSQPS